MGSAIGSSRLKQNGRRPCGRYIDHHLAELGADELEGLFGTADTAKVSPDSFLDKMHLVRAALYPASADEQVVLDYSINREATDYMLAVSIDTDGAVASIDVES